MDLARSIIQLDQEYFIQGPAGFLNINDNEQNTYYNEYTSLPIVFVHSFGGSAAHWQNQLNYFRAQRRVIAFDFRGHGKSHLHKGMECSPEALANDIDIVVDSLELNEFILVGHSMGGSAAIAYAAMHPQRVAALILSGTPGKTPSEQSKPILQPLESDAYENTMDEYITKLLALAKPEVRASVKRDFENVPKQMAIAIITAMFQFDPNPLLKKYKGPKFIIATADEKRQANSLHGLIANANQKTIYGTSHWLQMDEPEQYNNVLGEIISKIETRHVMQPGFFSAVRALLL